MKKIIYFLLLLQSPNLAFASHEFYVSICDIEHNTESNTLEITLKVFTDDFEKAVFQTSNQNLHLGSSKEHTDADALIEAYLQENLLIQINQRGNPSQPSLRYIGKEVEVNEMWCYLEIANVTELKSIEIQNFLLTTAFPKQNNIVNIRANNRLESLLMSKNRTKDNVVY